jgi:hypothetical protein
VRATPTRLEAYLFALATYLDRLGADLTTPIELLSVRGGGMGFDLVAALPSAIGDSPAGVRVAESWAPVSMPRGSIRRVRQLERIAYGYELVDHARSRRRAFHRHDVNHFRSIAEVEVHEHCEERLDAPTCGHYFGRPIRDGYEAIRLLLVAWTEPGALGCDNLECIEAVTLR